MYDPLNQTHPLLWSRACVYQVWWKSIHPNSSYRVHKGVNRPFLRPLLYLKNSRKIRKICTTPKFKPILYFGLEHMCTKFGENPSSQTWVIVPRSVFDLFDLCDLDLWPWVTKHGWGHFFPYTLSCGKVTTPNSHGKGMKSALLTDGHMDGWMDGWTQMPLVKPGSF